MKFTPQGPVPVRDGPERIAFENALNKVPAWVPDGPILRLPDLLKVVRVSRSKAYELMKSDPTFPKGTPLFDSDRSPRFYWTHEALAWAEGREEKFKRNKVRTNDHA